MSDACPEAVLLLLLIHPQNRWCTNDNDTFSCSADGGAVDQI